MSTALDMEQGVPAVIVGEGPLTIDDIMKIARREGRARLCQRDDFITRINAGSALVERLLDEDGVVYGVTTGYGDSCTVSVSSELANELPIHLTRFHGCGLGDVFNPEETRAILAVRLNSLAQGCSGVSYKLLEYFSAMLEHDILPVIPQEGSVGASGDLTPLSYVAGALIGERTVNFAGETMPAAEAFAQISLHGVASGGVLKSTVDPDHRYGLSWGGR